MRHTHATRPHARTLAISLLAVLTLWFLSGPRPAAAVEIVPNKLSVNGFFDTHIAYNLYDSGTTGLEVDHWVTMVNWRVSPRVRFFGDITLEHGTHYDEHGQNGDIKTRAFVQFQHSDAFKAAAGNFQSPFGHYNQVHDAVIAFTTVDLADAFYADRQVGVDALGTPVHSHLYAREAAGVWLSGHALPVENWGLRWDLYAINGEVRDGRNPAQADDNANKGIGLRTEFELPAGLHLGASWYSERHGGLGTDPTLPAPAGAERRALAAEAEWQIGPLNLQGEQLWSRVESYPVPLAPIPFVQPDTHAMGQYATASVAFGAVIPYIRQERYRNRWFDDTYEAFSAGVAMRASPGAVIKFQHKAVARADDVSEAQLAVAF
ncbi:MAG: hypothetical protein OEW11_09920 [Nitrospirota bacterium]|nr:hypothetical protein [Nitrospirota bacterium]